jgi:AcrR family transcriptional regulator
MEQALPETGWRGSPEAWLEAAYVALIDGGVDAVKILPLAKRLGLSRTSFYWFFRDREAILDALVSRWREKNTGNLVRRTEAYAETIVEAMLNLFDCWLDAELFDSQFEFAVRSWALQSPALLEEVHRADQLRIEAIAAMLRRFGIGEAEADVRARAVYLTQIGYISMQSRELPSVRMPRMAPYVEIFTGVRPQQREMDRFFARHNYRPAT